MPTTVPIHPISKTALIPVIMTHPDGRQQRYWISLERFMKERNRGIRVQRILRKEHKDVAAPKETAPEWESEFIENFEDFNTAGLKIDEDEYVVELVAEVRIKKNGKAAGSIKIKQLNREAIAREVLKKLMRL